MVRSRLALVLFGAAALAALLVLTRAGTSTPAQPPAAEAQPPQAKAQPDKGDNEIIQEFPAGGDMQTAWKVRYKIVSPGPGLVITGAWLKTSPNADWLKVLENLRLSEIFVPYNNGTRIYDIGAQGSYSLAKHGDADKGLNGTLLNNGLVVKELRDTGILWKYYDKVRRGQELVLWSTLGAGNYNYLMEYSFRCDGTINCRLGSTGRNLGNHETTGHMHHGCWRIDIDLDDGAKNNVFVVKRTEAKGGVKGTDFVEPFNKGVEGGLTWNPNEFTRLRVTSNKKNAQGKFMSYELLPSRPGTARHWGVGEAFTSFDFWVTPYQWEEQYYVNLPKFVARKRSIADTNVVLWYMSPGYHLPRDEDGVFIGPNGQAQIRGVAMTMWCGFELRPRNVFEKSPLYP
jgi:Cu2+-containing amine oxidase